MKNNNTNHQLIINNSSSSSPPSSLHDQQELVNQCKELQTIELETLISIYSNAVVVCQAQENQLGRDSLSISISIQIDLINHHQVVYHPHPSIVKLDHQPPSLSSEPANPPSVRLRYLPPFELIAKLPALYPIRQPPQLELKCDWAKPSDLSRAKLEIDKIWRYGLPETDDSIEGEGSIGLCVDWLQHDWIITSDLNQSTALEILLPSSSALDLQSTLEPFLTHDRLLNRQDFLNNDFQCPICLEIRKGRQCIQLERCNHVFCRDCLKDFFGLMITEGTIDKVRCCHEECRRKNINLGKQDEEMMIGNDWVTSHDLLLIVGPSLKSRYDLLFEKQAIESDPSLCFCPMDNCRALVKPDSSIHQSSKSEHLRVCPRCGYSFCFICKKTWHGPTNKCTIPYQERMIKEYMDESCPTAQRKKIERMLGGHERVEGLVKEFLENQANQEWKSSHTTPCVNCLVLVEKSDGCNHMICSRCQTHFCFRCGTKLNALDPYLHYSKPGSQCFNHLINLPLHPLDPAAPLDDHAFL